jgi:hypothetical protein
MRMGIDASTSLLAVSVKSPHSRPPADSQEKLMIGPFYQIQASLQPTLCAIIIGSHCGLKSSSRYKSINSSAVASGQTVKLLYSVLPLGKTLRQAVYLRQFGISLTIMTCIINRLIACARGFLISEQESEALSTSHLPPNSQLPASLLSLLHDTERRRDPFLRHTFKDISAWL